MAGRTGTLSFSISAGLLIEWGQGRPARHAAFTDLMPLRRGGAEVIEQKVRPKSHLRTDSCLSGPAPIAAIPRRVSQMAKSTGTDWLSEPDSNLRVAESIAPWLPSGLPAQTACHP
jgi:hypothetical protein